MTRYAQYTTVLPEKSRMQIERTIRDYGGINYISGASDETSEYMFQFNYQARTIRFKLVLPEDAQEERSLWRCLLILVKGKLEAIENGIETVDEAFMPQIVLPDQTTVADHVIPMINESYANKKVQVLLPFFGAEN